MDIQYKPTKQKKEKPMKAPKAPKAEKAVKFSSSVQSVKSSKPAKAPKAPKAPKPEKAKAMSFGKANKVQTDKPMKVDSVKKPTIFSKVDPKWILGGALVLIAAVAVIVLTVVLPAIEEHGQQIKHIMITQTPNKPVYLLNEELDITGLQVRAVRNNGDSFAVRTSKCTITGFDSKTEGNKTITVNYEGYTASFSVKVETQPPSTPVLVGIEVIKDPNKMVYEPGDTLDTAGGEILCKYADGSERTVTMTNGNIFTDIDYTKNGKQKLIVRRTEANGVSAETFLEIEVKNAVTG